MAHVAYRAGEDKYQHFTSVSSSCRHNLPIKRAQCHSCCLCCARVPPHTKWKQTAPLLEGSFSHLPQPHQTAHTRAEPPLLKALNAQKEEAQATKWESSRNRCSVFHVSIKASDNLKSPADTIVGGQWSKRTDCMKRKKCPMEFVTCLP